MISLDLIKNPVDHRVVVLDRLRTSRENEATVVSLTTTIDQPTGNLSVNARSPAHSKLALRLATDGDATTCIYSFGFFFFVVNTHAIGLVLLKNERDFLPSGIQNAKSIAMIGDDCNATSFSGGGRLRRFVSTNASVRFFENFDLRTADTCAAIRLCRRLPGQWDSGTGPPVRLPRSCLRAGGPPLSDQRA